MSWEL